jgi:hypothetical protein
MKFEIVESAGEWIVRREGEEVARFEGQDQALTHVAGRLREAETLGSASLSVKYEPRRA